MAVKVIRDGIFYVGAVDFDRRLFDELIPLPEGTSYNSYLVKGQEKVALIDTVDPSKKDQLIRNLNYIKLDKLDFIVANHAEQDHSGSIPAVLNMFPDAKVLCTPKCKEMLKDLLLIDDDRFRTVQDNEEISLGARTLKFIYAPWVHWPETMLTYLVEDKILFPCDFLGSHIASSSLFVDDEASAYRSAKRYYAEIMMPFRTNIRNHLVRLQGLDIDIIAPSHGYLYSDPKFILNAYADWVSDTVKNEVVVAFVSMHGSTRRAIEHFIDALVMRGIKVKPFNLSRVDIGELAMALVDAASVVVGSPMVLAGAHPLAVYVAVLLNALRPKTRFISFIVSYGWGGKILEQMSSLLANLKAELIEPVVIKGYPADLNVVDNLAEKVYLKHKESGLIGEYK